MSTLSKRTRSSNSRAYEMKKRAEQVADTRQRITEAAMRLHTSIGPANTTISAVAKEADVTRVTVYRHFPDEEHLFLACSAHWAQLHPGPDPGEWEQIADIEQRARHGLSELYGWYRNNSSDLYPILRDFEAMPQAFQEAMIEQLAMFGKALVTGSRVRGKRRERLEAVAAHVTSFSTWRSLAQEHGLPDDVVVDIAAGFLLSV